MLMITVVQSESIANNNSGINVLLMHRSRTRQQEHQ